jgi:N-acetylglucosamine-6-phosphate deacetylase
MEGTPESIAAIGSHHAARGVAAWLPTTVTAAHDETLRALAGIAHAIETFDATANTGARPVGIHLEGPFISHERRGVHPPACILPPDIPAFDRFMQAARGHIRLITIAPEVPGALDLIAHARALGVRISLGHSNATAAEALAGIAAGASSATHAYNAMRPLNHREPGMLGTVLERDDLFAELICDGIHVVPAAVRIFARAKTPARAILVTDSISATSMPDGRYRLGDIEVEVADGVATHEGSLAGSVLTLDRAIANFVRFTRCPLAAATRMASYNPALMLGVEDRIGTLAAGAEASLNILTPDGALSATYLRGNLLKSS